MSHGRQATTPRAIPLKGWIDITIRVWKALDVHHIGLVAAGVAFFGFLSIFPGLTAAVALFGIVADPAVLVEQTEWMMSALPDAARTLLMDQMIKLASASGDALGIAAIVGLALAVWSASKGMGNLIRGLNFIYEERESRGLIRLKVETMVLTLGLILGLIASALVVAAIPAALILVGAPGWVMSIALLLRWPILFAIGVGGIALLYRFAPSRRQAKWRWLTPGAVLACSLWLLGTLGFSFYVTNFSTYNETFGTLAGVIILLTWLWLSAYVVLLGAQVDAEIEAQTQRDSTIGPARPMGERGAVKADTVGPTRTEIAEGREPFGAGSR